MANLSKLKLMGRTLPRLGFRNIARVAAYRAALKFPSGLKSLSAETPQGPFFNSPEIITDSPASTSLWQGTGKLFSFHEFALSDTPPDWLANPLTGVTVKSANRPWHSISDFDPEVGDIKLIWELSRFCWLPAFAQRAKRGEAGAFDRLNNWLEDWAAVNPPYQGPNWKCGQESSLRVLHLIVAAHILGSGAKGLSDLITAHLKRIAPTVSYAMAQDNNHGTSEAAALFIGGNYIGDEKLENLGRTLLENRAARLVGGDGSFAQYSVNYHRLFLDALSLSEWWRAKNNLPQFSNALNEKMRAASDWLYRLTDAAAGYAPNIGANDGAQILQLTDAAYRDFRPSVALAQAVWKQAKAYPDTGICEAHLSWLGLGSGLNNLTDIPMTAAGEDGGFAVITEGETKAILRHPRFKFRPSQCDVLHLDIWHKGENVLRDGGTYSYNTDAETMAYFNGAAGHNSVQFDGLEQMPRLGRFLLGDWLTTHVFKLSGESVMARYNNKAGHSHDRQAQLNKNGVTVWDDIDGFEDQAVLRWRLIPDNYTLKIKDAATVVLTSKKITLTITADIPIMGALTEGEESLHYLSKTPLPVLEITAQLAGQITTKIEFTS